ncbi:hypothetical protein [Streptomyces glaucescens]|uniref:hypothetical protein n=1 Tax=Streptomyces glaucescens TaxID=1907 RepID=UPI00131CE0EE|nr:hypothetical protein [Streptomyces glaucescens]
MIDLSRINIAEFIADWYGPPDRPTERALECDHLPEPLRAWYDLAATYSIPLLGIKRFADPINIDIRNGKMVFLFDPSDAIWGFDPADPMSVYEGRLYGDWEKLSEPLPEFLVHNALGEAAYNAPFTKYCGTVANARMNDVLAPMTEVATGAWNWPDSDHRLFMGQGIVAEVGPAIDGGAPMDDQSGYSEVQVGATTPAALSFLNAISGIDWL